MTRIAVLLLSIASVVGCSKNSAKEELDCPAVADKVVEIVKADMGKLSESQRKALSAQLATIRSELIDDCKKDPEFFAPKAECIMKAEKTTDLEACEELGKPGDSDE